MNTAVYGVVRDDMGEVLINPEVFKCEDVLEGGGRKRSCSNAEKGCVGVDASEYLETLDRRQEHARCGGKERLRLHWWRSPN